MIGGHVDKDSCLKMLILALAGAAVPLDRTTPAPAKALGSNLCFYKTWNEGLIPHGVPIPSREKKKANSARSSFVCGVETAITEPKCARRALIAELQAYV